MPQVVGPSIQNGVSPGLCVGERFCNAAIARITLRPLVARQSARGVSPDTSTRVHGMPNCLPCRKLIDLLPLVEHQLGRRLVSAPHTRRSLPAMFNDQHGYTQDAHLSCTNPANLRLRKQRQGRLLVSGRRTSTCMPTHGRQSALEYATRPPCRAQKQTHRLPPPPLAEKTRYITLLLIISFNTTCSISRWH